MSLWIVALVASASSWAATAIMMRMFRKDARQAIEEAFDTQLKQLQESRQA